MTVRVLAHFGGVGVSEVVFWSLSGQGQTSLVVASSTFVIPTLVVLLGARIQRGIRRRSYQCKYDAARILARFGAQARNEVELDRLSGHLVNVVDGTMRPERVSLWLNGGH
jgi:hypothetical protein